MTNFCQIVTVTGKDCLAYNKTMRKLRQHILKLPEYERWSYESFDRHISFML